ncbi:two component transcriptional regulator, LuxR family [Faunimonas pinastri]|uniref:Two component transcriptional regulator, LuxR family n=1 Tax=Faunimonas pinastri TaxID=1855383 RepID=A0A1H9A6U4_9HYPH|nr:response regulator FixJ [Faunimonas pinastri]SEP72466.1 two component transcriptional regulator, LuxR family [Faunimonas pinastri]
MASDPQIHVIDDDEAVRDSIAFLLETADLPVKTHESAKAFLASPASLRADCIITDVRMPGITGIDLLRKLREQGVGAPVIVITGHADVPLAVEAMKLGAADFLEKPFDDEAFLASVKRCLNQRSEGSRNEAERLDLQEKLSGLSQREHQVLLGLVAGHPNKTIAYDLGISPRTVEVYRANVMSKMRASSLSDLVRMAMVVDAARL